MKEEDIIARLQEQLADLHQRNIHLEFKLRQKTAENDDHEKDYLAVWKALRPRHGESFMRPNENIAEAVVRLCNARMEDAGRIDELEARIALKDEIIDDANSAARMPQGSIAETLRLLAQEMVLPEAEGRSMAYYKTHLEELASRLQSEKRASQVYNAAVKIVLAVHDRYPRDVFPESGESQDCKSASMARRICSNILDDLERCFPQFALGPRGENGGFEINPPTEGEEHGQKKQAVRSLDGEVADCFVPQEAVEPGGETPRKKPLQEQLVGRGWRPVVLDILNCLGYTIQHHDTVNEIIDVSAADHGFSLRRDEDVAGVRELIFEAGRFYQRGLVRDALSALATCGDFKLR